MKQGRVIVLLSTALLAAWSTSIRAQSLPTTLLARGDSSTAQPSLPSLGSFVRVTAPTALPYWCVGRFGGVADDRLHVRGKHDAPTVSVPNSSVVRLDVRLSHGNYAGLGRRVGFLIGAVTLGAVGIAGAKDDPDYAFVTIALAIVAGGVGGMAAGWVIGGTIESDRWEPMAFPGNLRRVPLGSRIRATTYAQGGGSLEGVLAATIGDTLVVMGKDLRTLAAPTASIQRFELSLGKRPPRHAFARGALQLGLLTGAIIGGLSDPPDGHYGSRMAIGAAIGGAAGWAVGWILDTLGSKEKWETIPVERISRL